MRVTGAIGPAGEDQNRLKPRELGTNSFFEYEIAGRDLTGNGPEVLYCIGYQIAGGVQGDLGDRTEPDACEGQEVNRVSEKEAWTPLEQRVPPVSRLAPVRPTGASRK